MTATYENLKDALPEGTDFSKKVVVEIIYAATLNSEVAVTDIDNLNSEDTTGSLILRENSEASLEYSNNPNPNERDSTGFTPEETTYVGTYKLAGLKVIGTSQVDPATGYKTPLKEAHFKLRNSTGELIGAVVDGKFQRWSTGISPDLPGDDFTSGSDLSISDFYSYEDPFVPDLKEKSKLLKEGSFSVCGLDAGTYYLEETEAPEGYNKAEEMIKVVISASHDVNNEDPSSNKVKLSFSQGNSDRATERVVIENNKGGVLPETGGMGTTMLYTAGSLLVGGAAILLVTNKRLKKED